MRKNIIHFVVMTILFIACKSQIFVGSYEYKHDYIYHKLELKGDSTFTFIASGDLLKSQTDGQWNYRDEFLYLISNKAHMPYHVDEIIDTNIKGYIVTLSDLEGIALTGNYVCLNGNEEEKYYVDESGMIKIVSYTSQIKKINIYSSKGPFTYEVVERKANVFKINYNSAETGYLYFDNEKFKVQNNKLLKVNDNIVLKKSNRCN